MTEHDRIDLDEGIDVNKALTLENVGYVIFGIF